MLSTLRNAGPALDSVEADSVEADLVETDSDGVFLAEAGSAECSVRVRSVSSGIAARADEPVVPHFSGLQVVDLTEP